MRESNAAEVQPIISDDATPLVRIKLAAAEQYMTPTAARELASALVEIATACEYEAAIAKAHQRQGIAPCVTVQTLRQLCDIIRENRIQKN